MSVEKSVAIERIMTYCAGQHDRGNLPDEVADALDVVSTSGGK
jgi:hypothetical protein